MSPPLMFSMLLTAFARESTGAESPAPDAQARRGKIRTPSAEPASPWAVGAATRGPSR